MKIARDIMHEGVTCVYVHNTATEAAQMMAELNVGALPICGTDEKLKGMVTDRDLVLSVMAKGENPDAFTMKELASKKLYYVTYDQTSDTVLSTMMEHQIKRIPVIENEELTGIITLADVALELTDDRMGELVEALSQN